MPTSQPKKKKPTRIPIRVVPMPQGQKGAGLGNLIKSCFGPSCRNVSPQQVTAPKPDPFAAINRDLERLNAAQNTIASTKAALSKLNNTLAQAAQQRPVSPPKTAAERELARLERLHRGLALNIAMNPQLANTLGNQLATARRTVENERRRMEENDRKLREETLMMQVRANQNEYAKIRQRQQWLREGNMAALTMEREGRSARKSAPKTARKKSPAKVTPPRDRSTAYRLRPLRNTPKAASPEEIKPAVNDRQYRELKRLGLNVERPASPKRTTSPKNHPFGVSPRGSPK